MKTCTTCGKELALTAFYTSKGRTLASCRECTKARVMARYERERDKIGEYERIRSRRPERRAKRIEYMRKLRKQNPDKAFAWNAVSNALRDGRIVRQPCEICGAVKTQAHHADYSKPLDVRWLCFGCHRTDAHHQIVSPQ
jgi:hypothetical protein